MREDGAGERRLVAYVVARSGASAPSPAELRAHLSAGLPDYMVPAAFVVLDALPLTENGKLDRRALPAPDAEGAIAAEAYAAPRTEAERALAEVWREVLGVERVGIDDNYFALGGDSIRSIRLVAAARRRGISLSIPQLYQHLTVRGMAAEPGVCAEAVPVPAAAPAFDDARDALPPDVEDAYPVSRVQLAMLYHTERDPDSRVYLNVNGYRVHTRWDEAALREALRRVAARHPLLRTSFDLAARPEPLQRVHRAVEIPLDVADLRGLDEAAQGAAFDALAGHRFDWTRAPLLRVHVQRLSDDAFRVALAEHHAILDGWSVASLVTELLRTCAALRDGRADPAGAPPAARFRDFVALEARAVASGASRAFWRGVVEGAPLAALPPREGEDAPRTDEMQYLWIDVPAETAAGLRRAAEGAGVPLKTVLLAAHLRVLALLSGEDDVVTGYVTSGRPETEDGERVLGLFLNTVPLRVRMTGGTWLDLVRRAWAAEQALLPHRRFPLAEIVREAGGRTPFEAVFNFTHFHVYDALADDGVRLEPDRFYQKTEIPLAASAAVNPATGALRLRLEHDAARLGGAQARAVAGWYARALASLAARPEGRWDADALLDGGDAARLRVLGDGPALEADARALHARFERQARRAPRAPALVCPGGGRLTYGELDARAERLARRLRRRGVGRETVVGVCTGRSAELAVGVLGVLKSGGVYLPLDPAYPADRLAYMLADSGARVVVADAAGAGRLPPRPDRLLLDGAEDAMDDGVEDGADAVPGSPACVPATPRTSSTPPAPRAAPRAWSWRTARRRRTARRPRRRTGWRRTTPCCTSPPPASTRRWSSCWPRSPWARAWSCAATRSPRRPNSRRCCGARGSPSSIRPRARGSSWWATPSRGPRSRPCGW